MYTETPPKKDRSVAQSELKLQHKDTFRKLGLTEPYYTLKFPYVPKGRHEPVVSMFPSELSHGDDVFIEFTTIDSIPIYDEPVLYRLRHNPFFKTEYEIVYPDPTKKSKSERYLVPVAELELVSGNPTEPPVKRQDQPAPNSFYVSAAGAETDAPDCHANELTGRDWACIHLRIPMSNKRWLNDIIKSTK